MQRFSGVIPYLATPVLASGEIDEAALSAHCRHLIEQGVHGLTPLGSTGEFAYLDATQRRRVVEIVTTAAAGRVPVIPCISAAATPGALAQLRACEQLGASGVVVVLETYFPLQPAEVEAYFTTIADQSRLPVIIYTNPSFQRTDLTVELIARLARHPNIVGLKDASGQTGRLLSLINRCGDDLDIFAASAHIAVAVMMIGGRGLFAGPASIVPRPYVELYELCRARRWEAAIVLQKRLWTVNEMFARYNLAACVKAALALQGHDFGAPIAPQSGVPPAGLAEIEKTLAALAAS